MVPEPANGFSQCGLRITPRNTQDLAKPSITGEHRMGGLPGMIGSGEIDARWFPLPVEQVGDTGGDSGKVPVVGIHHVAGPKPIRGSVKRGNDRGCNALDIDPMPKLDAAIGEGERSPRAIRSTRNHSRVLGCGP